MEAAQLTGLFQKLAGYSDPGMYGFGLYRRLALAEVLLLLNTLSRNRENIKKPVSETSLGRINSVIRYLYDHFSEELSLKQVADRFHISGSHLCSLFKLATGMSLHQFIRSIRIMKAQELLERGYSVTEVHTATGFGDLSHFIRAFRRHVGVSPKSYAKAHKLAGDAK
jgi:AraC-like DNA-binding protein